MIDLKWALPAVAPFLVVALLRLLVAAIGAEWNPDGVHAGFIAGVSLALGGSIGAATALTMQDAGICWRVRVFKNNTREG
jgi:hypothetical protein